VPTTTAPEPPTTTTAPEPSPTTTAPDPGGEDDENGDDEGGDDEGGVPPASVGWSPTMLDFVTETIAAREACTADADGTTEPEPAQPEDPVATPAPECVVPAPEAEPAP
jgi:hypothetical protein